MARIVIPVAVNLIKEFESLHDGDLSVIGLQPKMCPAGILTVGYGHALRDSEGSYLRGAQGKRDAYLHYASLTVEQAEAILADDVRVFSIGVDRLLTRAPNDNQFGAMVSLAFNIGPGAFAKSTVLRRFNKGDLKAASNAFIMFNKSGGVVLNGLIRRRLAESQLFMREVRDE